MSVLMLRAMVDMPSHLTDDIVISVNCSIYNRIPERPNTSSSTRIPSPFLTKPPIPPLSYIHLDTHLDEFLPQRKLGICTRIAPYRTGRADSEVRIRRIRAGWGETQV